jgi:hypothetical protein
MPQPQTTALGSPVTQMQASPPLGMGNVPPLGMAMMGGKGIAAQQPHKNSGKKRVGRGNSGGALGERTGSASSDNYAANFDNGRDSVSSVKAVKNAPTRDAHNTIQQYGSGMNQVSYEQNQQVSQHQQNQQQVAYEERMNQNQRMNQQVAYDSGELQKPNPRTKNRPAMSGRPTLPTSQIMHEFRSQKRRILKLLRAKRIVRAYCASRACRVSNPITRV